MARRPARLPALALLAVAGLAASVVLVAVGAGLTGVPGTCPAAVNVGAAVVPGVQLDAVQLGLPARAEVIAIATAMQESSLRNIAYGRADSLGLFQQRPSQGWGTPAQVMDPVTSARSFYDALARVPGWQSLAVTVAAQDVQHSGFPGAYAQWQPIATRLVASFRGAATSCVTLAANVVPPGARAVLPRHYSLPGSTPATTVAG